MRRLLVTGGAGFIGANFVRYWLRSHPGDTVVVLDALTYAGSIANLAGLHAYPELRFVRGDIRDTDGVSVLLRGERIDTIVHFAAESHVDRSISGPDAFIETNVVGTHSMLTAARRVWLEEQTVAAHRSVDSRKIAEQLGYRATIDLARGLQDTVQWYLDNESWWSAVVDGSYRRVNEESLPCSK